MPDVILLAHGSPDPRARPAAVELARSVERLHGRARVHCAFLDHGPSLTDVAETLADRGIDQVVVVPAFLANAHHARVDVARAVADAGQRTSIEFYVTPPIGPDAALLSALDDALPDGPVVLAIAGTRDPDALTDLSRAAEDWARRRGAPVALAHASLGTPTVPEAIASLEADGSTRACVASFVLFPGVLPDRIAEAAQGRHITAPLAQLPATTETVLRRVRTTTRRSPST